MERKIMLKKLRNILCLFLIGIILGCMTNIMFQSRWLGQKFYPLKYKKFIFIEAKKYDLDPYLIAAVIYVESRFDPKAHSRSGACGLMQVMPETGKWIADKINLTDFQENDLYDPEINIKTGCWYLNNLREQFADNLLLVLAAYNGGHGNVTDWLEQEVWNGEWKKISQIPFPETRSYVRDVALAYKRYKQFYP